MHHISLTLEQYECLALILERTTQDLAIQLGQAEAQHLPYLADLIGRVVVLSVAVSEATPVARYLEPSPN